MAKQQPRAPKPVGKTVPSKERIKAALPSAGNSDERISWRFTHFDWDGPWTFADLDEFRSVEKELRDFETMTINELFHNGKEPGKRYEVARIPEPEALARLEVLKLADQDEICRLRVSGTKRLYGFLVGTVFHMVFWDPEHQVWLTEKKHT